MDALGPSILRLDPSTLQALLQRLQGQQGQQDAAPPGQAELAQALRAPDAQDEQASQGGGHVDVQALPLEDIAHDRLTPELKAQAHGDPDEEERLYQAMVAQVQQEYAETQVGDEQERAFAAQQAQLAAPPTSPRQEPDGDEQAEQAEPPPLEAPKMLPAGDEKQSRLQAMLALLRQ